MSALIAMLVLFGLIGQDDASTLSKQEVDKIVEANYGKVLEIGGQELIDNWDTDDIEDDTVEGR